jgi:type VI secretion system secreted protein VgrG
MTYTQDERLLAVHTTLGKDVLLLQGYSGEEGMSRLFRFQLDLLSENPSIKFQDIVGQRATISVRLPDASKFRYINGFVSRFSQTGRDERFTHYRAELVPWVWFLTRTSDCRIFQKTPLPDILKQVLTEIGGQVAELEMRLRGSYEPIDYCVQYNETDFNFVSRLMEQYGLFYFFEHEDAKHKLVIADTPSIKETHQPCPHQSAFVYDYMDAGTEGEDAVHLFDVQHEVRAGQYSVTDYNYTTPAMNLLATAAAASALPVAKTLELFEYPGEYLTKGQGDSFAKIRMQEEESPAVIVSGESACRAFIPGFQFTLSGHYRSDLDGPYVLTTVRHMASVGASYSTSAYAVAENYSNQFVCIPLATPFRPPRITPKPIIQGPQTAVVTGPSGEEIFTDKNGCVKVHFHWDRYGKYDDKSSCWIRVSQTLAGKGWGAVALPRIGQEVIVEFVDGDPDRPLITGRLYNEAQVPPYKLPDEKTKSTMKTLSSKGGGGFNEIRMEDAKGKEQVFIHSERNFDSRIKNDRLEYIGNESHRIVEKHDYELVKGDLHVEVKGDDNLKVGDTLSIQAAMDVQQKAGMKYGVDAGMEIHLKSGMTLVLEAGVSLTLKVGGNFVNINPTGVVISGTMVLINSGGAAGSGSGVSPDTPKPPKEADKAKPGELSNVPPPAVRPPRPLTYSPQALVLKQAAQSGTPFCKVCEERRRQQQGL